MNPSAQYQQILAFWFEDTKSAQWWKKDDAFDRLIAERFGEVHRRASQGELYPWRATTQGRLAEILVLDQFSRNIHRDRPQAFACDGMALVLAQEAVALGLDQEVSPVERSFFYMPYMHSESLAIHDIALDLFRATGLSRSMNSEINHRDIIARFGRYPHRNAILGRKSTEEELAFLRQPGSGF